MSRRQVHEGEGGAVVLMLVAALVLMAGAGYLAAYVVVGDKVPHGTAVSGVDIGGRSPADAVRALQSGLVDRLREPVTVTVGGTSQQITPEQAGISVDYIATVARAAGDRSWDPQHLWAYFVGGDEVDPVLRVDHTRMTAVLDAINKAAGTTARDGSISFASGRAEVVPPRLGAVVDTELAGPMIVEAWAKGEHQVALPLEVSQPRIDTADVRAAMREFANPALSGPVTLVFAGSRATLRPPEYAKLLRTRVQDGRLVPDVRSAELSGLAGLSTRDAQPVDATVALVDGAPRVVNARPGAVYGPADVTRAFLAAVVGSGEGRTVKVDGNPIPAAFTTRDARGLKITEQVASSTVPAADADLQHAVQQVSGTLVRPGETFSLNDAAGDVGAAGQSLATAAYDAAYLAGLEIVDRTAPIRHLRGAPLGREATVAWGSVDLRWRNDSPYGVLVAAGTDGGSVTLSLYSTKAWDVTASMSARRNFTEPTTVTLDTADCAPSAGAPGFEVDVTRTFHNPADGAVVRTDSTTTTYLPREAVACVPPAPTLPPARD